MGKGDKPRPLSVPRKVFDSEFDRIFKKKEAEPGKDQESAESKKGGVDCLPAKPLC